MKLILFRHGVAMERDEAEIRKVRDEDRPLTDKGQDRVRRMARALATGIDGEVDLLVSSHLRRAVETADVLVKEWKIQQRHECTELSPEAPPRAFVQWLRRYSGASRLVVAVGHEPQLSTLASFLLSGTTQPIVSLRKSGAMCIELESFETLEPRGCYLSWLVQPKLLLK